VTPSRDRGHLARIGSAQRTRQPVSAMCPGFGVHYTGHVFLWDWCALARFLQPTALNNHQL